MAEIKPIRAWRYNNQIVNDIGDVTAPLFDVVSDKQRTALYQNPLNSIHLSVPKPPDAANKAMKLLSSWKSDEVIIQDKLPAIYVYYQYFKLAGDSKEKCRKGFVCHIRTYPFEENVILRHENTIPQSVNDRIELLKKTELHVSPTHGLYTDQKFELEKYMDAAITNPVYEAEDYQGVRDVLAIIHDAEVIKKFIAVLQDKTVILADGHHRYESSLVHMQKCAETNPNHTGNEGYNFHLMYLTNTQAGDLRILPTHRLIKNLKNFSVEKIISQLSNDFIVREIEDADTLNEIIVGKKWAFGLLFKDRAFKVKLKPEVFSTMRWHFPEEVRELDLTVMHYFIIEKILGIQGKEQRASENITFDRSFSDCLTKVIKEEAQMAIITQEVSIDEVKKVCHSGSTMPQKSTYFYPKVICGFLFSSIKEKEFKLPEYSPF
ncbi:MAG: DUF1015 domain-containing protein [Bacteroidetes bacterium]|nr:DUF1015 domain-containing protein [Bacteroidota bacterium]